jgi:hypothetical protein
MIEPVYLRRSAVIAAVLAANLGFCETRAALMITSFESPMTENFDTFAGTNATIPANFTWSSDAVTGVERGVYDSAGPYNNNNGLYALYYSPTSTTDRSFGTKRQPNPTPAILTWSFVNQTGADISEFDVSWDVEQYAFGNRPTAIDFDYNPNGAGATQAGITGTTQTVATTGGGTGQNLPSPIITSRSVSIALATPLANGQTIDFRWITTGNTGGMANAHIGVDNLSVIAIPEPSTACIGGLFIAIAGSARTLRRERRTSDR